MALLLKLGLVVGTVIGSVGILIWPYWGALAIVAMLWLEGLVQFAGGFTLNRGIGIITLIAILVRMLRRRERLIWNRLDFLLIGYLSIAFLSLLIAGEPLNMQFQNALMGFLIYWLFVNSVHDDRAVRISFWIVIAGSVFVAGSSLWELLSMRIVIYDPLRVYRFSGFKYNPNTVGELAFFALPFLTYFFLRYRNVLSRLLLISLFAVNIAGLLISGSRAAFLSMLIALISLPLMARSKQGLLVTILSASLLIVTFNQMQMFTEFTVRRLINIPLSLRAEAIEEGSAANQLWLNQKALLMFSDHPFLGVGFGNFLSGSTRYPSYLIEEGRSHNILFNTAAETGLAGVFALIFIGYEIIRLLRVTGKCFASRESNIADMLMILKILWLGWIPILMLHRAYLDRVMFVLLAITIVVTRLSKSDNCERKRRIP
jgi:O-antigen ligase